jgi:hypothetical protein
MTRAVIALPREKLIEILQFPISDINLVSCELDRENQIVSIYFYYKKPEGDDAEVN